MVKTERAEEYLKMILEIASKLDEDLPSDLVEESMMLWGDLDTLELEWVEEQLKGTNDD